MDMVTDMDMDMATVMGINANDVSLQSYGNI